MKVYKLRAEALIDIFNMMEDPRFHAIEFDIKKEKFYDITFTFKTSLVLDQIISIIEDVKDGHVMLRTIQPIRKYTGELIA
jgi:hypothetical protein